MEYAKYPFKYMRITQNIGDGNHLAHWKGSKDHSDKPWDEAGKDSGQDSFCPLNDFKIEQILGISSSVTNTVILKSAKKLHLPYGVEDYLFLTLTHINEKDLKKLKVGQVIKAGECIKSIREGVDGNASGNHLHITANIGKYHGLLKNSNGKWCYTYDKSLKPEEAFYLDNKHTTILNAKGSIFKEVSKESFFGEKGYFSLGDTHKNIGKICKFMHVEFSKYGEWLGLDNEDILGNYYGPVIEAYIKEFQKRAKADGNYDAEIDGCVGPLTLKALKKYGFKE